MMEGFFTKKESELTSRPTGKTLSCISCGLYKSCEHPKMEPYGNFAKRIMVVGEAPDELDDKRGIPFQGKQGRLLQKTFDKLGIDLFEDCIIVNACLCRPTDDRPPSNFEIDCCRKTVFQTVKQHKPIVTIILGNPALYSLIGHRWKKDLGKIPKWRGWAIPDQELETFLCPTFSPSSVERSLYDKYGRKNSSVEQVIWEQDLDNAFSHLKTPFPLYKEPSIEYLSDLSKLSGYLGNTKLAALDYETTGLKPHRKGHRIVCTSIAKNKNEVCVFMMPENKIDQRSFIRFLRNKNIDKMAHNMKYEEIWSCVILGQPVLNWRWDSMQAAHVFDNRKNITSLKFQTYINFGIADYASEITPYFQSDTKDANSFNRIDELLRKSGGKEKLLKYNAYDSINEYRLAEIQMDEINCNEDLPF